MSSPRPVPKYGRCGVCDKPLGKDGECWFYPTHSQKRRPDLRVVEDNEMSQVEVETVETTGVIDGSIVSEGDGDYQDGQLSLSAELFDRYAVEAVKVTVAGTIEIPLEMLETMTSGLEPGDMVAFTCRGHVADVSTPYRVKDHAHDGRLVLKAELLHGVEVLRAD